MTPARFAQPLGRAQALAVVRPSFNAFLHSLRPLRSWAYHVLDLTLFLWFLAVVAAGMAEGKGWRDSLLNLVGTHRARSQRCSCLAWGKAEAMRLCGKAATTASLRQGYNAVIAQPRVPVRCLLHRSLVAGAVVLLGRVAAYASDRWVGKGSRGRMCGHTSHAQISSYHSQAAERQRRHEGRLHRHRSCNH
jgi:hypothetical protein